MNVHELILAPFQSGTFARRLLLRFGIIISMMMLAVGAAFVSYDFIDTSAEELNGSIESLSHVEELESTLWELRLGARDYQSAPSSSRAAEVDAARRRATRAADELKGRSDIPASERAAWVLIGESASEAVDMLVAGVEDGTGASALQAFEARMTGELLPAAEQRKAEVRRRLETQRDHVAATVDRSRSVMLWLLIVVVIASIVMSLFFTRRLMRGLRQLRRSTRALAREDFNQRFEYEGNDEIAEVAQAFNDMAFRLAAKAAENRQLQDRLQQQIHDEKDKATLDPLTQLRNRRHFEEVLSAEMERVTRTGSQFSIAIIDLDNFKQVNDRHGHDEGDAVLQRTARTILRTLRPYDQACRLGGEEFGIIFPETNSQDASIVMERIMESMSNVGPNGTRMTFSGGIAVFPMHAATAHELYKRADEAAYTSKQGGKAQVTVYSPQDVGAMDSADRREQQSRGELDRAARTLVMIVDEKDPMAGHHSQLTARYSAELARYLGLDEQTIKQVHLAGLFHDIGKIAIPDDILTKPGRLTPDQYAEMKKHSEFGYLFLRSGMAEPIPTWVRHHHEHYDGSGYPSGLRGDQIPVGSRIILVADAFDAMTSDRVYRRAMTLQQAMQELTNHAGRQFDPQVVQVMLQMASYGVLEEIRAESGQPFVSDAGFQYGNARADGDASSGSPFAA